MAQTSLMSVHSRLVGVSPARTHIHIHTHIPAPPQHTYMLTHSGLHTHPHAHSLNQRLTCAHAFSKITHIITCIMTPTMPLRTFLFFHMSAILIPSTSFSFKETFNQLTTSCEYIVEVQILFYCTQQIFKVLAPGTQLYVHVHTHTRMHTQPPSFINTLGAIYCCYSWEQLSVQMLL